VDDVLCQDRGLYLD
jgi:hypothetical protein